MSKLEPEELWRKHTLELFEAFRQSGELERLRKKGLSICGRKKKYSVKEWWNSFSKRYSLPGYREFATECATVGQKFGLAPWTVYCTCLVSGYDPAKQPFPIESEWPIARVVTESTDPDFLARLAYEAQKLGAYVVQRQGSVESVQLFLNPILIHWMEPPSLPPSLPPRDSAFKIRVEVPTKYPPEAAARLQKEVGRLAKELGKRLGYSMPQRLRSSRLVFMANKLRLSEAPLPKRALYEIVAETDKYGSVNKDEQRRKTIKTRRHRLRKRLIEPYQTITSRRE